MGDGVGKLMSTESCRKNLFQKYVSSSSPFRSSEPFSLPATEGMANPPTIAITRVKEERLIVAFKSSGIPILNDRLTLNGNCIEKASIRERIAVSEKLLE